MITSNEAYIEKAQRTSGDGPIDNFQDILEYSENATTPVRLIHVALGLSTEVGELNDAIKKHLFYGKELDKINIEEEMGDIFWYLAELADALDITFEGAMNKNIEKLKKRFPDKFTNEVALNRDLKAERASLESGVED